MKEQATIYDEKNRNKMGLDRGKDDLNSDKSGPYYKINRAMIDLETLGTSPGCVILQIGLVTNYQYAFDKTIHEEHLLSIEEQKDRTIDPLTLVWWMQHPEAATRMMRNYETELELTCVQVAERVTAILWEAEEVWANSPSFDCVILSEFISRYGGGSRYRRGTPWEFHQERDFRTVKALHPDVPYVKPEHAHSALADAQAQVDHLIKLGVWR